MPGVGAPESAPLGHDSFVHRFNNNELPDQQHSDHSSSFDDGSVSHSSFDDSSHNDGQTDVDGSTKAANEVMELARTETNHIRRWRLIVLVFILVTGAAVGTGSYVYLRNEESNDSADSVRHTIVSVSSIKDAVYLSLSVLSHLCLILTAVFSQHPQYTHFTHSIQDASERQFHEMQLGFCDMAETITTAAINNDEDFPFVRVKLFEVPAKQTRELTGIEMFSWNPFVTEGQREAWYNFTQAEQGWYDESKEIVINDSDTLLTATSYSPGTMHPYIWRSTVEADGSRGNEEVPKGGPFAPIWQMSPPPFDPALLQYDMFGETYVETMLPVMFRTRDGLMSALDPTLSRLAGLAVTQTDHETFHSKCVTSVNGLSSYDHPHSVHLQPVFKKLQDPTSELVGFLALVVPWDCYLANLLPHGVNGVYAVLKNTCGQAHTYILRGNRADYLGEGDMHDENYHDTEVIVPLTQYRFNETRHVEGHCVYSFYLYSSEEYESASETDLPVIFAVAVGVIFITMALTFLVYDRFVHRRNMKVVDAASKSNQIINTLFPQQVRDRLFADKSDDDANVGTKSKLMNMMNSGDFAVGASSDDEVDDDIMYKTKPIADLFPETTILFADIAGTCNAESWLKIISGSDDQSSSNLYLSIPSMQASRRGVVCANPVKSLFCWRHSIVPCKLLRIADRW